MTRKVWIVLVVVALVALSVVSYGIKGFFSPVSVTDSGGKSSPQVNKDLPDDSKRNEESGKEDKAKNAEKDKESLLTRVKVAEDKAKNAEKDKESLLTRVKVAEDKAKTDFDKLVKDELAKRMAKVEEDLSVFKTKTAEHLEKIRKIKEATEVQKELNELEITRSASMSEKEIKLALKSSKATFEFMLLQHVNTGRYGPQWVSNERRIFNKNQAAYENKLRSQGMSRQALQKAVLEALEY